MREGNRKRNTWVLYVKKRAFGLKSRQPGFQYSNGEVWLNGSSSEAKRGGFTDRKAAVAVCVKRGGCSGDNFAFQLSSQFMNRGFDEVIEEVLVYGRELSEEEALEATEHLGRKWGNAAAAPVVPRNKLVLLVLKVST